MAQPVGRARRSAAAEIGLVSESGPRLAIARAMLGMEESEAIEGDDAALLALLSDGAAWSTSALAVALGSSQRTVQRTLAALQVTGRVRAIGQARAQRWVAPPLTGFTTVLLLPMSPSDLQG